MSKTAMQTLRQSLDFAYYEASVTRTPGEVLSQIRFQTVDLIAKEREQVKIRNLRDPYQEYIDE
jgi:hypothetical protein